MRRQRLRTQGVRTSTEVKSFSAGAAYKCQSSAVIYKTRIHYFMTHSYVRLLWRTFGQQYLPEMSSVIRLVKFEETDTRIRRLTLRWPIAELLDLLSRYAAQIVFVHAHKLQPYNCDFI